MTAATERNIYISIIIIIKAYGKQNRNITEQRQTQADTKTHSQMKIKKNTHNNNQTKHRQSRNEYNQRKKRLRKISTTQKYIIRVQGHILYYTMCRNTAHGRHIIYVYIYIRWSSVCVFTFLSSYLREFCMDVFRLFARESLTFKFSSVVALTVAIAAAWALVFRFFFPIILLNATAYGRIFCTFTRYIGLGFSLYRMHSVTIDFLLHFVLRVYAVQHMCVRVYKSCALLLHFQFFMKFFYVCDSFVLGPSQCSLMYITCPREEEKNISS